jgi:hypothetical protein
MVTLRLTLKKYQLPGICVGEKGFAKCPKGKPSTSLKRKIAISGDSVGEKGFAKCCETVNLRPLIKRKSPFDW